MSDTKSAQASLELITQTMNELAREVGTMEPDDPKLGHFLKELFDLSQLRRYLRIASDHPVGLYMDELAREMTTLKPGDPRRAQIVHHIMRLQDLLKEI
jgi:DNA repair ATPase RecN